MDEQVIPGLEDFAPVPKPPEPRTVVELVKALKERGVDVWLGLSTSNALVQWYCILVWEGNEANTCAPNSAMRAVRRAMDAVGLTL